MSAQEFDELTKALATGHSRRGILKLLGRTFAASAAVGGVSMLGSGVASAAVRTCTTCSFGTGQPCNVKSTTCVEGGAANCPQSDNNGHKLCGTATFHCPRGCR